jgi:hypothetical protein
LVNERTRLAAVLPAKAITTLARRIPDAIAEVLCELGAAVDVIEDERRAMTEIVFAKTASRSVLGTMNDFSFHLELRVEADEDMDHPELAMFLNRMPVSPLDYGRPDEVARELLGIAMVSRRAGAPDPQAARTLKGAAPIYELRVALREVTPEIWRRVQVRSSITLASLHRVLQTVMGWSESHLHEFRVAGVCYGSPHPELPPTQDERKALLGDVLSRPNDRLTYVYDFGDGWEHEVALERVLDAKPGRDYPRVMGGERACPPEDCGGVSGYSHLLEVLRNPKDWEHRDLVDWVGGSLDPEAFDADEVNGALRRGWSLPKSGAVPRSETTLPGSVIVAFPRKKHRP